MTAFAVEQEHIHEAQQFSVNQQIVCKNCMPDQIEDECHCKNCHPIGKLSCRRCQTFHNKLHKGYE